MKNKKAPKKKDRLLGYLFYKNNIKYLVNLAEIIFEAMKFIDKLSKNDIIIYNFVYIKGIL